jgi:CHAD domain-containing protein
MTVNVEEIETKYDAPEGAQLPAMDDLPGVASAVRPEPQKLEAEYFDTRDLRLIRSGITLRRRTGGTDDGWHLKLPVGPNTRREIREPLGTARQVPDVLLSLVRGRVRGEQLLPVAQLITTRQPVILLGEHDEPLAEVAVDDVRAETRGDSVVVMSWREVEVELTGGSRGLLEAADLSLRRHGLLPAGRAAKLERALGVSAAQPTRLVLSPASPAADVIGEYLRAHTEVLVSLDPLVRRNEPDAVHQMRVTTRRLRSVLQAYAPFAGPNAHRLVTELRWLGGVLGAARDAEVLAAHLLADLDRLPAEQVVGPVRARVQGHFASVAADDGRAVIAALDSRRYLALLDDLDALAASPAEGLAAQAAGSALPAAVARAYRRTRRRARRASSAAAGPAANTAWHDVRKSAKRARYAAEVVAPALGSDASRFARQMKDVQTALGDYQDTVVVRQAARQLGMSAHLSGENAFSYGVLYQLAACDGDELLDDAQRVWKHAARPRYRRWLGG